MANYFYQMYITQNNNSIDLANVATQSVDEGKPMDQGSQPKQLNAFGSPL
jgi:hypothetical protein